MYQHRMSALLLISALFCFVDGNIVPKLLLPYHADTQVNYTIHADEGCYSWRSLRTDVATIESVVELWNEEKECSSSATVTVRSTQPVRKTTLILATSADSGTIFQCDVIVDKITMIDIVSRTKELYLEDPPEKLKIRALDEDGNTFSSTAGLKFEWSLTQIPTNGDDDKQSPVSPHSILRIQRFMDTIYIADPYVTAIEKSGKLSDTILVSGIQTGSAIVVSAIPASSALAVDVKDADVQLVVKDKVMLNPGQDVYLLVYSNLQYRVERWRKGKPTQIHLPCAQYKLKTQDKVQEESKNVVLFDEDASMVTGLNYGESQIILLDMHLSHHHEQIMEQAKAGIYVVEPSYLTFQVAPHGKWILQLGDLYIITVHIFDKDNHEIWRSDNIDVGSFFDKRYFEIIESTKNSTWFHVKTLKVGFIDILATLNGVFKVGPAISKAGLFSLSSDAELVRFENPVSGSQTVQIVDGIVVIPALVVFPWQNVTIHYTYQFVATGGSGNYTWSISDRDLGSVGYGGKATFVIGTGTNQGPRQVNIIASDLRNLHHNGEALVAIATPIKIEFSKFEKETELGTEMYVYLTMFTKVNGLVKPITDCSRLANIEWEINDESIYKFIGMSEHVRSEQIENACLQRKMLPLKEGHTILKLTYEQAAFEKFNISYIKLTASTILTAFHPLRAIDPPKLAVVSLEATKVLKFLGGPIPWPTFPGNHVKVTTTNNDTVSVFPKISTKEHTFIAHCLQLGSTDVTLYIYNKPVQANPMPKNVSVTVTVSCDVPVGVKLSTNALPKECPLLNLRSTQGIVTKDSEFFISIMAYDNLGNQFDNFTTLQQDWSSDPKGLKNIHDKNSVLELDENQQSKQRFMQAFMAATEIGDFTITLDMKKYEDYVKNNQCRIPDCFFEPSIKSSLSLQVIKPILISRRKVVLFNSARSSETVEITGGSGYFDYEELNSEKNAIAELSIKDGTLHLKPMVGGRLKIHIKDLCIEDQTATVDVTVSDIAFITIQSNKLIELESSSQIDISLFDIYRSFLNDILDSNINITLVTEPSDIISLDVIEKTNKSMFVSKIVGMRVGEVTVFAMAHTRDMKLIASNKIVINVFPPLEIVPPVLRLVHGSLYYMRVEGGPPSDVSLQFGSDDGKIVGISQSGVLTANKLGKTYVWVKAVTQDGKTFNCKKPAEIHVVIISSIRIHSPITRFYEGATVPIRVYGVTENSNEIVDLSCENTGFLFTWKALNKGIINLQSVHLDSGVHVTNEYAFTMFAIGLMPGQSLVQATLKSTNHQNQMKESQLSAELQLTVYQPLSVRYSESKSWATERSLLVAPSAICSIASNRDVKASEMVYKVLDGESAKSCVSINTDEHNLIASDSQCKTTLEVTSVETFGVNQTLSLHVQVRSIAYVIAKARSKYYVKNSDKKLTGFPLDSNIEFDVTMYDHSGNKFDCTSVNSQYLLSRSDLVQISNLNNLIVLHGSYKGVTVIKLWPSDTEDEEYDNSAYHFPVPVYPVIQPYSEIFLVVGEKHCLRSDVVNEDQSQGTWLTKSPDTFLVHAAFGAILPVSVSQTTVEYHLDFGHTSLPITAKEFYAKLSLDDVPTIVTNAKEEFIFPFTLQGSNLHTQSCTGLEYEMDQFAKDAFKCNFHLYDKNNFNRVFHADVSYISSLNTYACVVTRLTLSDENTLLLSTFSGQLNIGLTVNSNMLEKGSADPSQISVKFVPAFFILKNDLRLILLKNDNVLCISACDEVFETLKLEPDESSVKIAPSKKENNVQCYGINVDRSVPTSFIILVSSNLIDQTETVRVTVDKSLPVGKLSASEEVQCAPNENGFFYNISNIQLTYIATIFAVIISTVFLVLAICLFKSNRNSDQNQTIFIPNVPTSNFADQPNYSFGSSPYIAARTSPNPSPSPRIKLWSSNYIPSDAHTN